MSTHTSRQSRSLAARAAELALAVPQVVVHRMTRMALAGPLPSARDQKEFQLMLDEKKIAFNESWSAMAVQSARAHQALATSFWLSFLKPPLHGVADHGRVFDQLQSAALGVWGKGLAPVHRKAVANARRLAGTPLR
jgi:hypothetical protein